VSASEIAEQLGLGLGGELDAGALGRMVDHEVDGGLREGAYRIRREDEADEVHGRELALLLVGVADSNSPGTANSLPTWIHMVGPTSMPMKRSRTDWIWSFSVISMKRWR